MFWVQSDPCSYTATCQRDTNEQDNDYSHALTALHRKTYGIYPQDTLTNVVTPFKLKRKKKRELVNFCKTTTKLT